MRLQQQAVFSDKLKDFIQNGNYESYILELMNRSQVVFPSQYKKNLIQSKGECDFYDLQSMKKYEAKLPFDKQEGRLICSKDSDLKAWIQFMMDEEAEFGDLIILNRGKHNIEELQLYKTLEKRLNTVQADENAIIIFPYPITCDLEPVDNEFSFLQITSDILSTIFSKLRKNGVIGERYVYAIYPSMDEKMVLRCLNTNKREYLFSKELREIFAYSFILLDDDK